MSALAKSSDNNHTATLTRCASVANQANILTDIYREDTNIVIWQRKLTSELSLAVTDFVKSYATTAKVLAVTPQNTHTVLSDTFGESEYVSILSADIAILVDMFCCLFGLKRAGLRLTVLERAMCPRFHVDRIPCRLVTTYQGIATQWLNHDDVDRTKLGAGNQGKPDESSGLFKNLKAINQLTTGDVALLKGENWDESQGAGLVHRSPPVSPGERRLLLTLDFMPDD